MRKVSSEVSREIYPIKSYQYSLNFNIETWRLSFLALYTKSLNNSIL